MSLVSFGGNGLANTIRSAKYNMNDKGSAYYNQQLLQTSGSYPVVTNGVASSDSVVVKPVSTTESTSSLYDMIVALFEGKSSPKPAAAAKKPDLPSYPLSSYYGNLVTPDTPEKDSKNISFSNNVSTRPVNIQSPSPDKAPSKPNSNPVKNTATPSPPLPSPTPSPQPAPSTIKKPVADFVASQDKLGPFESPYGKYTIYQ
jgi:hypothetical protein